MAEISVSRPFSLQAGEHFRSVSFLSQHMAQKLDPLPNSAIISITNPGEKAILKDGWNHLLRVAVADSSYDEQTIAFFGRLWWVSSYGFPVKETAEAIRRFLNALPSTTDTLFVHCGAGVSRSAAVAKYVSERHGLPFPADYDRYNAALYRLLVDPSVFDAALAPYPPPRPSGLFRLMSAARSLLRRE